MILLSSLLCNNHIYVKIKAQSLVRSQIGWLFHSLAERCSQSLIYLKWTVCMLFWLAIQSQECLINSCKGMCSAYWIYKNNCIPEMGFLFSTRNCSYCILCTQKKNRYEALHYPSQWSVAKSIQLYEVCNKLMQMWKQQTCVTRNAMKVCLILSSQWSTLIN